MIEMAESSALNSDSKVGQGEYAAGLETVCGIKKEVDESVKPEPQECAVCVGRRRECRDMLGACTTSGASLHDFLCRFTRVDLASAHNCSRLVCKDCLDLINVLEQAEIEYFKLKETFEAIINKNPLFDSSPQPLALAAVKAEVYQNGDDINNEQDSEDEPLAQTKKKKPRKAIKRKKKSSITVSKQKGRHQPDSRSDSCDRWECEECGVTGEGGAVVEATHKLTAHTLNDDSDMKDVKTEDSADGSQSSYFDNSSMEPCLKIEFDMSDDHSSTETFESVSNTKTRKKKSTIKIGKTMKSKMLPAQRKKSKVIHQCDQCDAKYSSWIRLERHKHTHDGSKPPYICEVCGAHYKHKRACDIHIALHKGISNWKCEECNKLFPSKSALQRHNNIHTGKLNYQCDLCGKSFIHTSSFKMHKLSHSGVKPHACDVCGLALMTRSHLKRHKRVHSGEKRHECPICGKRFSERYNLVAHGRSHEAPQPAPPPARRLFRCPYCPERYERRYMLERHTAQAHGCTLERPLATPRNTMSKLLKAQAQRRAHEPEAKVERGNDSRSPPPPPPKATTQLAPAPGAGSWSGAYAAEFLRADYTH